LRSRAPIVAISVIAMLLVVLTVATSNDADTGAPSAVGASGEVQVSPSVPTVGVTSTEIRIGVTTADPSLDTVLGARPEDIFSREELSAAWRSGFVGHETIHGREVVVTEAIFQPTDLADPVRQCRVLTEDEEVFAVLSDQFVLGGSGCVAVQHRRLLLANANEDQTLATEAPGLVYAMLPSLETTAERYVAELDRRGLLDGRKIGVLGSEIGGLRTAGEEVMVPALREAGADVVASYYLSSDVAAIGSQIPVAVDEFRQAGVDLVVAAASAVDISLFANRAEQVDFRPSYVLSDMGMAGTYGHLLPPSVDGAVLLTAMREYGPDSELTPAASECQDNFESLGGPTLEPGSAKFGYLMRLCQLGQVFVQAAEAVGEDLTTQSFATSMQRLGEVDLPAMGPASFGPGELEAADGIQQATFDSTCRCFVEDGQFETHPER
jgi:hypothetical protein